MSEKSPLSNACFDKEHDICDGTYRDYMCTCSCHAKPTFPDPLAQIAESLKPVGEFFEALRDGRLQLVPTGNWQQLGGQSSSHFIGSTRVIISPKEGE